MNAKDKDKINSLARKMAKASGWQLPKEFDFLITKDPKAQTYLQFALIAFEEITGDRPDYADDD
jgi:hypothetical protein